MNVQITLNNARAAAIKASNAAFDEMGRQDAGCCGFAWCDIYVDGRSKLGKTLKAAGLRKSYDGGFQVWNPGELSCQNIDVKEAGARAYANVLQLAGMKAYAGSRLD